MTKEPQDGLNKDFKYADFSKRLFAYNIDMTVLMLPCAGVSFLIDNNKLLFFVCFLIVCLYHALLESSDIQATLGKKYAKIRVVDENMSQLSVVKAFLRILLKFLSLFLLFTGFFVILFRKDRRGYHDILLKTFVVLEES